MSLCHNEAEKTRKKQSWLMVVVLLVLLVGCETRESMEEVRSVEWYEIYEDERNAKLAKCRANPEMLDGTPNCVTASLAENNVQDSTKWQEENDKNEIRVTPLITK